MTRLTKSSSLGGATPTARPSHSSAPVNQFDGSSTVTSGVQVSGPLNTTISPGSGSPNQYGTLFTRTRSPVQPVQPCRVCSIDPEGMKKACTKKVLTIRASTKAISRRTGSSRSSEPRSEEHTSELQSRQYLVCRLLLEKKKQTTHTISLSPD